ncbi:unnamed protein product [Closterium sp. Naga37s-1]|nr:unnamed protein product [Closterium sp. Naga37s-1]
MASNTGGSSSGSPSETRQNLPHHRALSPHQRPHPPPRPSYPPDPRAFDFSFALNNPDFSDRCLSLEIAADELESAQEQAEGYEQGHEQGKAPQPQHEHEHERERERECGEEFWKGEEERLGSNGMASADLAAAAAGLDGSDLNTIDDATETPAASAAGADRNNGGAAAAGADFISNRSISSSKYSSSSSSSSSGCAEQRVQVHCESTHKPRRVQVHVISAILVSQSDFFKSLFSPQWRPPPPRPQFTDSSSPLFESECVKPPPVTIRLAPEEERPFMHLLHYLYTGRLGSDDPEAVLHLLLLANKFSVLSCVDVCAHHLREVPLTLDIACTLLRVCSNVALSDAASFLLASSSAFLVQHFTSLDATWQTPDFLSLPLEALQALLGSDDVGVQAEETVLEASLHWVRHHWPDDLPRRKEMPGRLAGSIRFPAMATSALHALTTTTPEADTPTLHALVTEALWFKCSSFERQQQLILDSLQPPQHQHRQQPPILDSIQQQHRRYQRRRQLSVCSEVLLQDCYMLQPGQAIMLAGGTWLHGKLFSLKVMRVAAPVGGSDCGLFLQASQRSPSHDRVLDDSVTIEFTFLVKDHPSGQFVQQKQTASHTFKGLFRERGYRSLLNPWSEVVRDNGNWGRGWRLLTEGGGERGVGERGYRSLLNSWSEVVRDNSRRALGPGAHLDQARTWTRRARGPGAHLDQARSWTRSALGPGALLDQVRTWTRRALGPGALLDQARSWTTRALGPGALLDQARSWTRRALGPGALLDQARSWTRRALGPGALLDQARSWTRRALGPGALLDQARSWTRRALGPGALLDQARSWTRRPLGPGALLDQARSWTRRALGPGALLDQARSWTRRALGPGALLDQARSWTKRALGPGALLDQARSWTRRARSVGLLSAPACSPLEPGARARARRARTGQMRTLGPGAHVDQARTWTRRARGPGAHVDQAHTWTRRTRGPGARARAWRARSGQALALGPGTRARARCARSGQARAQARRARGPGARVGQARARARRARSGQARELGPRARAQATRELGPHARSGQARARGPGALARARRARSGQARALGPGARSGQARALGPAARARARRARSGQARVLGPGARGG